MKCNYFTEWMRNYFAQKKKSHLWSNPEKLLFPLEASCSTPDFTVSLTDYNSLHFSIPELPTLWFPSAYNFLNIIHGLGEGNECVDIVVPHKCQVNKHKSCRWVSEIFPWPFLAPQPAQPLSGNGKGNIPSPEFQGKFHSSFLGFWKMLSFLRGPPGLAFFPQGRKMVLCFHLLSHSWFWAPYGPWKGGKEQNSLKISRCEQKEMSKASSQIVSVESVLCLENLSLTTWFISVFTSSIWANPEFHPPLDTSTRSGSQRIPKAGKDLQDHQSSC